MIFIITLETINESNLGLYENFLINRLDFKKGDALVYGAKYEDIPCGAILAFLENDNTECEVKSFFVLPFFRRKGVGTELLAAVKNRLKQLNVKKIRVNAVTSKKSIGLLEEFLLKRGFSNAKLLTEVYLFDPKVQVEKNKFVQTILNSDFKLPDGVKILPKNEVSKELLEKVRNKDGIEYPDNLSPFVNEHNLDDGFTQFAVFDDKEIVGWLTAFKTPGNSILYRSLFVREDYRKSALGCYIFNSAIKIHVEKHINKNVLYAVALDNIRTQKLFSLYLKNLYTSKKYEFEVRGSL